jgi:hypothetical protein
VIRPSQHLQLDDNGTTVETAVTTPSCPLVLGAVTHLLSAGLGILFIYLGTTKLLGRDEAARLAAMGVSRNLRDTIGSLELAVAGLFFAGASGYLLHSLTFGVALIEVGLLHRPPLAAGACLAAHGLSSWARSAHERRRMANAQGGRPVTTPDTGESPPMPDSLVSENREHAQPFGREERTTGPTIGRDPTSNALVRSTPT